MSDEFIETWKEMKYPIQFYKFEIKSFVPSLCSGVLRLSRLTSESMVFRWDRGLPESCWRITDPLLFRKFVKCVMCYVWSLFITAAKLKQKRRETNLFIGRYCIFIIICLSLFQYLNIMICLSTCETCVPVSLIGVIWDTKRGVIK